MILWAVFFLSFSGLAFEILLMRLFAVSQWNAFSFMVISIALFGFAAGGVLFALFGARMPGWERRWTTDARLSLLLFAYTLSALFSLYVLSRIPFDYFRLPLEPIQAFYLGGLYLMLGLVFFFGGLAVMLGFAAHPEKSGAVYCASMAGSACGAASAIPLLSLFGETGAAAAAALIPLAPAVAGSLIGRIRPRKDFPASFEKSGAGIGILPAAPAVCILAVFLFLGNSPHARIDPSPYKGLSQALRLPDSRIFKTASGIYGRVDTLESPHLRFAPGLSLKFTGTLPDQWAAYLDGDHPLTFYETGAAPQFARFTLPYAGYGVAPRPKTVLVLQNGGGTAIPCAMAAGSERIIAVEPNPVLAALLERHYGITVVSDAPRAVLAQTGPQFDVIHVENWGASLPGITALNPDYLLTVEALTAYWKRLSANGVLIITRKLRLPPSDSLRVWATAYAGLRRCGVLDPSKHLWILRNWDAFVLIAAKTPGENPEPLLEFARKLNFDFVFSKPPVSDPVNRYHRFPEPYYHRALGDLAAAHENRKEKAFFQSYLLDVRPPTDDGPYPDRFMKYRRLPSLYQATGSRFYTLWMSGEMVVAGVLLEAAVLTALFLLAPVFSVNRKSQGRKGSRFVFFFSLGAGFMFFEMTFIQAIPLLIGNAGVGFVIAVTGILLFSGIGAALTRRFDQRTLDRIVWGLALLGVLEFWMLNPILQQLLTLPQTLRTAAAFMLLLPMGLPAGIPFPLGMRILLEGGQQRAVAWAANGCASVLTAVAAVQAAISFGISTNLLLSAGFYLVAWQCLRKPGKGAA